MQLKPIAKIIGMCGLLTACEVTREYEGHRLDPTKVAQLTTGQTTQEDIYRIFGSPTCVLSYDPYTWYYLSQVREKKALVEPYVTRLDCYAFEFTPQGRLQRKIYSDRIKSIALSTRAIELPSSHGQGVLKQIFGNVGRFPIMRPN